MRRLLLVSILSSLCFACEPTTEEPDGGRRDGGDPGIDAPGADGGVDTGGLDAPIDGDAPGRTRSYTRSTDRFTNPERGFYRAVDLLQESELSWLREDHPYDSLVYSYLHLDDFRDRAIPAATLSALTDALDVARDDGFEVILRFAYNEGPYPDSEPDAPLSRIQAHITQVAPILAANTDVIAVVQAGFIGAWGEWHTSTNDLDEDPAARRAVIDALLAALPSTRSTQVRYPPYIADLIGGEPLDASRAWDGSFASRIGFHNDCFVSSNTDVGTYPSDAVEEWRAFASAHTAFAPSGGETCDPFPARSACEPAIAEMEAMHFSFVNRDYHPDIVSAWEDDGCIEEIDRRLGYRFVLTEGSLPDAVRPGGSFVVALTLTNEGFAAPFNPRPLRLVIDGPGGRFEVTLPDDVRHWLPGEHELVARLGLPALDPGEYTVSLWLPSSEASVASDPAFSIRLANQGVWDASAGSNTIGTFMIDASAPGTGDPSATVLRLLPR
jgi:hypothetical protein